MFNHLNQTIKNPERVILLGGTGFVGLYLQTELKKNNINFKSYSSKDVDLTNEYCIDFLNSNLQETDSIVILSCLTPDKGRDVETLFKNLKMANNLGKVISNKKFNQIIYISSDAVYGVNTNPISESTFTQSLDNYSYMHIGRELILKESCQKMKNNFLILRPVGLFGLGDTHNSYGPNRFFKMAKENKKITLFGGGEEKRDHLDVRDFSNVIINSILFKTTGLLNVATGDAISFKDVADKILLAFKKKNIEITLELLPRSGEVSHKHFDITLLRKAFPLFKCSDMDSSISGLVNQ